MARIGLVADDLTGACDSALPFLGGGPVRVGIWPHTPGEDAFCAAVSTESRSSTPAVSRLRSARAARRLHAEVILFRKLDSMLRGNPLADLEGVLSVTNSGCLVAPALPAEGRVTMAGVQRWPGGHADLRDLLRPLGLRASVCDASSDGDLLAVAREALAGGHRVIAGTAGLAGALARALGLPDPPAPAGLACRRPLALVGSLAARSQAAFAAEHGWEVQVLAPGDTPATDGHDGLVLTGGETAASVLKANGAKGLELLGQALPRIPACRVRGGRLDGLPVVLKAGAFGRRGAIHRAMEVLSGRAA